MHPTRPFASLLLAALLLAGCAGKPAPIATQASAPPPPTLAVPAGWEQRTAPLAQLLGAQPQAGDPAALLQAGKADWALLPVDREHPLPPGVTPLQSWADPTTPVAVQEHLSAPKALKAADREALPPGVQLIAYGQTKADQAVLPIDGILPTQESIASGEFPWAKRWVLAGKPLGEEKQKSLAQPDLATALGAVERVQITAVGDFMLARGVWHRVQMHGGDTTWPVALVKDRLAAADLTFANLESALGTTGTPLPNKGIWLRAPPEAVNALTAAGVDAVTVANNHILDYDRPNFQETLDLLQQAGIAYVGGGKNLAAARAPLVVTRKGVRIAFLGYSEFAPVYWDARNPIRFLATETDSGIPPIQVEYLKADIQAARQQADIVIVTFHWGVEFTNHPTPEQERIAHLCIDEGAQVVLGYHPHAIQGVEHYGDGWIVYSLGNFIMDQFDPITRESMLVDLDVEKSGVKNLRFTPVQIDDFRPHLATGDEATRWWQKWATLRVGTP